MLSFRYGVAFCQIVWECDRPSGLEQEKKPSGFFDLRQALKPGKGEELVRVLRYVTGFQAWSRKRNHQVSSTCDKAPEVETLTA